MLLGLVGGCGPIHHAISLVINYLVCFFYFFHESSGLMQLSEVMVWSLARTKGIIRDGMGGYSVYIGTCGVASYRSDNLINWYILHGLLTPVKLKFYRQFFCFQDDYLYSTYLGKGLYNMVSNSSSHRLISAISTASRFFLLFFLLLRRSSTF